MSRCFFYFACLLTLYSVALHVNGQIQEVAETSISDMSEKDAIAEIKKRIMFDKYRKTPTIAVANMLAKATCYIQGVEECLLLGRGNSFQTPEEVLRCVRKYTKSSEGPCAIKI